MALTQQEIEHILYFQKWQSEYSKAAMSSRDRGFNFEAAEYQEQAANCYRTILMWRGD